MWYDIYVYCGSDLQLTPSSSNVQPYTVIAVTDAKKRQQLSEAMLGSNARKVATAPVTVVFAADLGIVHCVLVLRSACLLLLLLLNRASGCEIVL